MIDTVKNRIFHKNNYTGYQTLDIATRISENEDLDEQWDKITRISIVCNSVLQSHTKKDLLDFLISHAGQPLAFHNVKKIYMRKLDEDASWTAIEWFFEKDQSVLYRRALARTLIQIAHSLWRQYNKAILYPDAIQMYGGHRSTDISINDLI